MSKATIEPISRRINRILATPNTYKNFPNPVPYNSKWGYVRIRCPVKGCEYDGISGRNSFNQHYARKHAPEQYRQKAQKIAKIFSN